jgi:hypothetical protein
MYKPPPRPPPHTLNTYTAEPHLSALFGTSSYPDMQKFWIIGFYLLSMQRAVCSSAVTMYSMYLRLSLTSALDGGGWSTPRPGRFSPGKTRYPLYTRPGSSPKKQKNLNYSFFNLGARWWTVVNATPRPLYPGKDPVPIVWEAGFITKTRKI